VARKGTAVRALIGVDAPAPVPGVTGKLRVFVNGGEVAPAGGVPPDQPDHDMGSANRNDDSDTLNVKGFYVYHYAEPEAHDDPQRAF
jgi:hypothetical protein